MQAAKRHRSPPHRETPRGGSVLRRGGARGEDGGPCVQAGGRGRHKRLRIRPLLSGGERTCSLTSQALVEVLVADTRSFLARPRTHPYVDGSRDPTHREPSPSSVVER